MKISEVTVVPVKPRDGLIGFAALVVYDSIYLGNLGIYTKIGGGYRITYPTRGTLNVYHPINRRHIMLSNQQL